MMAGRHRHKCPVCGTVWEHGEECGAVPGAHTCPKPGCTGSTRIKYMEETSCERPLVAATYVATSPSCEALPVA